MATSIQDATRLSHVDGGTDNVVSHFSTFYEKGAELTDTREENAQLLSQSYYDLVTDFFEYGYGDCFHFWPVYDEHTLREGAVEYCKQIGRDLHVKPGGKILDIGCGIGGPGRIVALETKGIVTGLNINEYQMKRGRILNEKAGLQHQYNFQKGDFGNMHMFNDNSFDAAFACQSSTHAQDPLAVYKEIYRVLKPGGYFVDSAWVMTDKYEPGNPSHEKWKLQIMIGDGLPDIRTNTCILSTIKEAGLEVVESNDYRLKGDLPWYTWLVGKGCSVQSFRASSFGRACTHYTIATMETLGCVPAGSTKVHGVLQTAAEGLVAGGKAGIFSPMLHIVSRKPLN